MAAQRFAIYARRSRSEELEPGEREQSTDRQVEACKKFAELRGWTVAKIFKESGVSAYRNHTRAEFDDLLAFLERGEAQGVLFWKIDRAVRNTKDVARLVELVESNGIVLASATEGIDTSSPMGSMLFELMGSLAKLESRTISVRTKGGKESLALSGRPSGGGPRRYGFEDDQVTVVPAEAVLLQEACQRVLSGVGLNTICRDFNDRGERMADGTSLWQPTALRRMLLRPRSAGLRGHGGNGMEVMRDADGNPVTLKDANGRDVPAIIDIPTWTRIRAVLMDPTRRKGGHPVERMLSGIPLCGSCRKGKFHGRLKGGKLAYVCSSKSIGCWSRIDGVGLERSVTAAAIDWLCGDGLVRAREQLAKGEAEHEAVKAQLAADEAKLMELADAYAANNIDMPSMLRARAPIQQRISKARAKLDQVPRLAVVADLPNTKRKLTAAWRRMSVTQQRAI